MLVLTFTASSIVLVTYFVAQEQPLKAIGSINRSAAAAIILLSVVSLVLRGYQFGAVTQPFGIRLGHREAIGLSALQTVSDYLPARGGIVVRGLYLNRVHGMAPLDYAAMTGLWFAGNALSATILGAAAATMLPGPVARATLLFFAVSALALALGGSLVGRARGLRRWPSVDRSLKQLARGFKKWGARGPWRARFAVSGLCLLPVAALRFSVAASALGYEISFFSGLVIQAVLALSLLVSITPGNVGIREALAYGLGLALGIPPQAALAAALIERAASLIVALAASALLGPKICQYRAG